ncbi:MAG: hypothetical protein KatS3mg019_0624 [Fimbriimonadales bacterium]|nr:MAG: hypothetical protein KatS3mg019_0624 [Fimbriimonadales bacterium]
MKTYDNCRAQVRAVLEALKQTAPDAPLLALGQTIFWDEPMKLALLHALREADPDRTLLFGVHDTDYFARLPAQVLPRNAQVFDGYALLPHNDGTTRALWSAAGEIAQLFGSETVPTLKMFARNGGNVERVARACAEGKQVFVDTLTEAWGWRGLVAREPAPRPVYEVPLREITPALDALLEFGLDGTCALLDDAENRARACDRAWRIRQRVQQLAQSQPDASLADLYVQLYPELLETLWGDSLPETVGFTRTTELLRFNTRTAHLPRFEFLNFFLNPVYRRVCEDAYNAAVQGSPIYPLNDFGEGALPFDLLIPKLGRGTILLTNRYLCVLTPEAQIVRLSEPITNVHGLAQVIEQHWGDSCTLVGKAITLITMLAREFVFVFNERGSPYLSLTTQMHQHLQKSGVPFRVNPLLRLSYPTWDALAQASCAALRLPQHLACAFGEPTVCSDEFAKRWRPVVAEQRALLERLAQIRSPRALMQLLAEREGDAWQTRLQEYEALHARLAETIGYWAELLRQQAHALHAERRALIAAIQQHPHRFGELAPRLREIKARLKRLNTERLRVANAPEARSLHARADALECEAERARLELIRCAFLTSEGLAQTHARPAAWWFLLLSHEWFRACTEGLQVRLEAL